MFGLVKRETEEGCLEVGGGRGTDDADWNGKGAGAWWVRPIPGSSAASLSDDFQNV